MLEATFAELLLKHFADGNEHLCMQTGSDGILAMCILRPEPGGRWTTFKPPQAQLGPVMIEPSADLRSLLHTLPGYAVSVDLLGLDAKELPPSLASNPLSPVHYTTTMSVAVLGSFDDYWSQRSGNLRSNVRRYLNRLKDGGIDVRYRVVVDAAEIEAAVTRYGALEMIGWKGSAGTAVGTSGSQHAFYLDLLRTYATNGRAEVHELWLGSDLAASRLTVRGVHGLDILKTAYSERLGQYAPGRLLLYGLIREEFATHPGTAIEFNTDVTSDQAAWATHTRPTCHLQIFRNGLIEFGFNVTRALKPGAFLTPPHARKHIAVDQFAAATELPEDVRQLMSSCAARLGMQVSPEWFELLDGVFVRAGRQVAYFTLRHDGKPVALLPVTHGGAWDTRVDALSNYYTSVFAPALTPWLKPSDLVPLIESIRTRWPGLSTLSFDPMEPGGTEYVLVNSVLIECGLVPFPFFRFGNWTLAARGLAWADYLAARDSRIRNTVARMARRFARRGGRIEIIEGGERVEAGIEAYEQVYASSWKKTEPDPEFVRRLIRTAAQRGWLRLGVAWLDGQPIATQLWFVAFRRAEIFKLAYDEDFKALSPGTLLTAQLMQRVLDDDHVDVVDYLTGDDAYKRSWMTERRERWGIVAYNPRTVRGALSLLREAAGRVVRPRRFGHAGRTA